MQQKKVLNLGVLAHVDAGKTTLTEQLLFQGGTIKKLGNVDKGSSVTDSLEIERKRGISIMTTCANFNWNDMRVNVIDTPGHIDFCAEVERSLRILDLAIVIISAVEGVQSNTYGIVEGLKNLNIPFMIFVNKLDRSGSDVLKVVDELETELNLKLVPCNFPTNESEAVISFSSGEEMEKSGLAFELWNKGQETIAETDDDLLESYLNGIELTAQDYHKALREKVFSEDLIITYFGVAKLGLGIPELLNSLAAFVKESPEDKELSALVFKIEHDKNLGRVAYIRVFKGNLKVRDTLWNNTQQKEQKVSQIKLKPSDKFESVNELSVGDIGLISGIPDIQIGDILGSSEGVPPEYRMQNPVLEVQVNAKNEADYANLAAALSLLSSEDPNLGFIWYKKEKELCLTLMGKIQMEILEQFILDRFGIETEFSQPNVIYKETPLNTVVGSTRYTMPKPCWAVLSLKVEKGEAGSGISFESKVGVNDIAQKYQNEIEQTIPKALAQGLKAWEVIDAKFTLVAGEDHPIHSRPGDFILATPMAVMDALVKSGTQLLEPYFEFELLAEEIHLGVLAAEFNTMRASFEAPVFFGESFKIKGKLPIATSLDFPARLGMLTSGKGKLRLKFGGYQLCEESDGQTRLYKGVNPMDRSQWILHHRGAFKAEERSF